MPQASRSLARALRLASIAGAIAILAGSAFAGATDPTLAIAAAASNRGQAGRLVQVIGVFPAEDLIQRAHPIGLLVRVGGSFARFDLSGGVWTGFASELSNGFELADVPAVLAASVPAPDGRLVALAGDRVEVMLPRAYPGGASTTQLFLLDPAVLSNTVSVSVALP